VRSNIKKETIEWYELRQGAASASGGRIITFLMIKLRLN